MSEVGAIELAHEWAKWSGPSEPETVVLARALIVANDDVITLKAALLEACSIATTHLPEDRERVIQLQRLARNTRTCP